MPMEVIDLFGGGAWTRTTEGWAFGKFLAWFVSLPDPFVQTSQKSVTKQLAVRREEWSNSDDFSTIVFRALNERIRVVGRGCLRFWDQEGASWGIALKQIVFERDNVAEKAIFVSASKISVGEKLHAIPVE
jgi:hypothetical protein